MFPKVGRGSPPRECFGTSGLMRISSQDGKSVTGRRDNVNAPTNASNLTIDREALAVLGRTQVCEQLQAFARSTSVEVDPEGSRLLLRGTSLTHHDADPHLLNHVHTLAVDAFDDDFAGFHLQLVDYDLCMEDSWTGYFVAKYLTEQATHEPLVFIHLDDHTDMMSTLLIQTNGGLSDPSSGRPFDPIVPADWKSAIGGGAIGIGSFVTALYYLQQPVHVIHLNHAAYDRHDHRIFSQSITHPLLPQVRFATIQKRAVQSVDELGTYTSGSNVRRLLSMLPQGRVIVHIDLDYFINDYNGNIGTTPAMPIEKLRERASLLLTTFFEEIRTTGTIVERWIIATSPGFCSARHWRWLLDELSKNIKTTHRTKGN